MKITYEHVAEYLDLYNNILTDNKKYLASYEQSLSEAQLLLKTHQRNPPSILQKMFSNGDAVFNNRSQQLISEISRIKVEVQKCEKDVVEAKIKADKEDIDKDTLAYDTILNILKKLKTKQLSEGQVKELIVNRNGTLLPVKATYTENNYGYSYLFSDSSRLEIQICHSRPTLWATAKVNERMPFWQNARQQYEDV